MTPARVLIADPSPAVGSALRSFLAAEFEVKVARTEEEALELVSDFGADLVLSGESPQFHGEGLCAAIKARDPRFPVVLIYPPDEPAPDERASQAGAEACLVGPLKAGTVLSCIRNVLRVRTLERALELRTGEPADEGLADFEEPDALPPAEEVAAEALPPAIQAPDFQTFRTLLAREVTRSRRYRYPVSLLVVGLDGFGAGTPVFETTDPDALIAEALATLVRNLREVDLVSPFRSGSFVAFLPHTPAAGAMTVAERLRERLSGLLDTYVTASVGVAGHEGPGDKDELSFGTLIRRASDALAEAQREGGDRVLAEAPKQSAARRRRSRISIA